MAKERSCGECCINNAAQTSCRSAGKRAEGNSKRNRVGNSSDVTVLHLPIWFLPGDFKLSSQASSDNRRTEKRSLL